jgi:hypothetical protein
MRDAIYARVTPKRRLVEKYADATAWEALGPDERNELVGDVAGFPVQVHFEKQGGYRANANPLRNRLFGSKSARPKHILEDSVAQVISEWLKESGEAIQTGP